MSDIGDRHRAAAKKATPRKSVVITHGTTFRLRSEEGHEVEVSLDPFGGGLIIRPLHDQYFIVDYDLVDKRHFVVTHIRPGGYRGV